MSCVNKDCDVTLLAILRERGGATRAREVGATLEERREGRRSRAGRGYFRREREGWGYE